VKKTRNLGWIWHPMKQTSSRPLLPSSCWFLGCWVISFNLRPSYRCNQLYMKMSGHRAGLYMVMLMNTLNRNWNIYKYITQEWNVWNVPQNVPYKHILRADCAIGSCQEASKLHSTSSGSWNGYMPSRLNSLPYTLFFHFSTVKSFRQWEKWRGVGVRD
jgi:hypothetical protein